MCLSLQYIFFLNNFYQKKNIRIFGIFSFFASLMLLTFTSIFFSFNESLSVAVLDLSFPLIFSKFYFFCFVSTKFLSYYCLFMCFCWETCNQVSRPLFFIKYSLFIRENQFNRRKRQLKIIVINI